MKKIFITLFLALGIYSIASAQKLKEDVSFLKDESTINLVFDYDGMTVEGKNPDEYAKRYIANSFKDKPEEAEEWKKGWDDTFRTGLWRQRFIESFTVIMAEHEKIGGDFPDAGYTIIIKTNDIFPGTFAGPFSKQAILKGKVTIVKTGTTEPLATIDYPKGVYGNTFEMYPMPERRIGAAYNNLGKIVAALIGQKLK